MCVFAGIGAPTGEFQLGEFRVILYEILLFVCLSAIIYAAMGDFQLDVFGVIL